MQILMHMYEHRDTPPEGNSAPSTKVSVLKVTAPKPRSVVGIGIALSGKGQIGNHCHRGSFQALGCSSLSLQFVDSHIFSTFPCPQVQGLLL